MINDSLLDRQLGRTEYTLLNQFEYYNLHNDQKHIEKCIAIAEKLEKNGWIKSRLYQSIIKPFKENHKTIVAKGNEGSK